MHVLRTRDEARPLLERAVRRERQPEGGEIVGNVRARRGRGTGDGGHSDSLKGFLSTMAAVPGFVQLSFIAASAARAAPQEWPHPGLRLSQFNTFGDLQGLNLKLYLRWHTTVCLSRPCHGKQRGANVLWTEEAVEALRRLALEGRSATMIAAAIGAGSRNAVIGKANRIGVRLGGGSAPEGAGAPGVERRPRPRTAPNQALAPRRQAFAPALVRERGRKWIFADAKVGEMLRVGLEDVGEVQCRWPVGDPMISPIAVSRRRPVAPTAPAIAGWPIARRARRRAKGGASGVGAVTRVRCGRPEAGGAFPTVERHGGRRAVTRQLSGEIAAGPHPAASPPTL